MTIHAAAVVFDFGEDGVSGQGFSCTSKLTPRGYKRLNYQPVVGEICRQKAVCLIASLVQETSEGGIKAAVIYKGIILNIRRWRDNIIPVAMKLITLQVHPLHLLI
jgi:hypothetical protein